MNVTVFSAAVLLAFFSGSVESNVIRRTQYPSHMVWCPCTIDYGFIWDQEPYETTAYVPHINGNPQFDRGVVIGHAIDLGTKTVNFFRRIGIAEDVITMLTPYLQLTGMAAKQALEAQPLTLSNDVAKEISILVMDDEIHDLEEIYDNVPGFRPSYRSLTCAQRTALMSVYFQYRGQPAHTFGVLWSYVINQQWAQAITLLRNYGDSFPARRRLEADLLENDSGSARCVCNRGMGGECHDPHFTTFDGRRFSYQGVCSYVLFTDGCGNKPATFRVDSTTEPGVVMGRNISRVSEVTVRFNVGRPNERVVLLKRHGDISVDGKPLTSFPYSISQDVSIDMSYLKETHVRYADKFTLTWDGKTTIQTYLYEGLHGQICGLLGDADGEEANDFRMPSGKMADKLEEFCKSWEVPGSC